MLKVLDDPSRFTRCDAAVLYLSRGALREVREGLEGLYREPFPQLRRGTPVFTKPLASGVALAEDPEESFSVTVQDPLPSPCSSLTE